MSEPKLGWDTGTTPSKTSFMDEVESLIKMCDDKDKEIKKLREIVKAAQFLNTVYFDRMDDEHVKALDLINGYKLEE